MEATIIRGSLPEWATAKGSGHGDGYGYGDGSGHGDGYGYGSGHGDGDGYGYGSGSGSGHGDGDGYGGDVARCIPLPLSICVADLRNAKACADHVRLFEKTFPAGAEWPRDIDKAKVAGLDLEWAKKAFGLMEPK